MSFEPRIHRSNGTTPSSEGRSTEPNAELAVAGPSGPSMNSGNEAFLIASERLQEMARTGNETPFKSFLNEYTEGRSVGGGTGVMNATWSEVDAVLQRAGLAESQRSTLQAIYPRAVEAWFGRALATAAAYGAKDEISMMESTFDSVKRAAARTGLVRNSDGRVADAIRAQAPAIYARAVAQAKDASAQADKPWMLDAALGNIQTYGPLAGLTQDQITAAKAPYMSQYRARFEASVGEYAAHPKRGYWQNNVKDTAKRMWQDAQRVLGNDKQGLKQAKQSIEAAKKECARVTALSYLEEKPDIFAGFGLIQANIYGRMAGINTFRIWGVGVSDQAKEFFDARRAFVARGGPGLMVSYAIARVVNLINFVRGVSFYT